VGFLIGRNIRVLFYLLFLKAVAYFNGSKIQTNTVYLLLKKKTHVRVEK